MSKDNLNLKTTGCELCLYDDIEQYEMDYLDRRRTVLEIVDDLKVNGVEISRYKFYNHIRHHLKPEVALVFSGNAELLAKEMVDKAGELIDEIDRLRAKILGLEHSITADADPSLIKAYIGLEAELRRSIEALAKLSGDMKQSQHLHVNNLTVEYNNIVDQVMQYSCPNCKVTFAKIFEPLLLKRDGKGLSRRNL